MESIDLPKRDNTPKSIFNPLRFDYITSYRNDFNVKEEYKIRSMEIETFPAYIANHIIKHLIVAVQNERKINPIDSEAIEEIRKEIEVNVE